eukprot:gene31748-38375_t
MRFSVVVVLRAPVFTNEALLLVACYCFMSSSGTLYPAPQHSLPLQYGDDVSATAKADFNVIDVLSFCRMIVAEDKKQASIRVNSFPQLMAESISAVQRNLEMSASCKRKWQDVEDSNPDSAMILGLRVNGTFFYFYRINVSRPILSAIKMKGPALTHTIIKMVGGSEGLNFLDKVQRAMGPTSACDLLLMLSFGALQFKERARDQFGYSLSLSVDGSNVIVGAPFNDGTDGGSTSNRGSARVFAWSGSSWLQRGGDIDGETAGDNFGASVATDVDGQIIAVGAPLNRGTDTTASNRGSVRAYAFQESPS